MFYTKLSSLTLSIAFIAGHAIAAKKQWLFNYNLLGDVSPTSLRRIQLCVYIRGTPDSDIMEQVKQTAWRSLDSEGVVMRFSCLEEIHIIIKGADIPFCNDVWQEIEKNLYSLCSTHGIRLTRGKFCIL